MIIKFNDGSFVSIDKEEDVDIYLLTLCGKKQDGSATMSYAKLSKDNIIDIKDQIEKWLKEEK